MGLEKIKAFSNSSQLASIAQQRAREIAEINPKYNYKGVYDSQLSSTYYSGVAGDCYLYLGNNKLLLDNSIAAYGDIIYFDGAYLRAEKMSVNIAPARSTLQKYDICILGGGAGGIGAAYALRNSGYKVCLVERLSSLGGTHCNAGLIGMLATPVGDWFKAICKDAYDAGAFVFKTITHSVGDAAESTFDKNFRGAQYTSGASLGYWGDTIVIDEEWFKRRYFDDLKRTIDIKLNRCFVSSVEDGAGTIKNITVRNEITGGTEVIWSDYFIDCTGDVYLGRYGKTLDTDFYIGTDPKALYNEAAITAGFLGDHYELNSLEPSFIYGKKDGSTFTIDKTKLPTASGITAGANGSTQLINIAGGSAYNMSPDYHAGLTSHDFIDSGYDATYMKGIIQAQAYYKGSGTSYDYYMHNNPLLAIREGYRMKCDRMLTQSDIGILATTQNAVSNHTVAIYSWPVDFHINTNVNIASITVKYCSAIPYESLVSAAHKNLLIACRGLGASHIVQSALRLTKTMLSVGYAAGKAIKQARDGYISDVRNVNMQTLQADCGILTLMRDIQKWFYTSLTPQNELVYDANYSQWTVVGTGGSKSSSGIHLVCDGVNEKASIPTFLKASTQYGILYNISACTTTGDLTSGTFGAGLDKNIGLNKKVLTSIANLTPNEFKFAIGSGTNGEYIDIDSVRLFEAPAGSTIATDFATKTPAQLNTSYPMSYFG